MSELYERAYAIDPERAYEIELKRKVNEIDDEQATYFLQRIIMEKDSVFDIFVQLELALRDEVGPMTYGNPVQKAIRRIADICGVDWRKVGETAYAIENKKECVDSSDDRRNMRETDGQLDT